MTAPRFYDVLSVELCRFSTAVTISCQAWGKPPFEYKKRRFHVLARERDSAVYISYLIIATKPACLLSIKNIIFTG